MLRSARLSCSGLSRLILVLLVLLMLLGKERWPRGRLEGAAEGPQSVLENHPLRVALALSLRLDAVVASRFLLAALDTAFSTGWRRLSTMPSMSTEEEMHLLKHPVLVRRFGPRGAAAVFLPFPDVFADESAGSPSR